MQVQLDDILAGKRMRGGKCKDERLINHAPVAAQNPAKRRFPWLWLCGRGESREGREGFRAADANHGDPGRKGPTGKREYRILHNAHLLASSGKPKAPGRAERFQSCESG